MKFGGRGTRSPAPVSASLYRLRRQTALRGTASPLHVNVSGEVRIVQERTIASLDLTKKDLPAALCGNHNREVRCSTPESMRDLFEQQDVPLTLAHAKFVKAIDYAKVKTD